jgi:arylsulfatase A-like enzyme
VILVSDNGASGEGGPNGSVNENKLFNGIPDDLQANLAMIDELGGPKTYNHYANGWAMAFNTPFKMWKRYEFNGGTSDPGTRCRSRTTGCTTYTTWSEWPNKRSTPPKTCRRART